MARKITDFQENAAINDNQYVISSDPANNGGNKFLRTAFQTLRTWLENFFVKLSGNNTITDTGSDDDLIFQLFHDNEGIAEIRSIGHNTGVGILYAGQDSMYGGGIAFRGNDISPIPDFPYDQVIFFRRSGGNNRVIFRISYNGGTGYIDVTGFVPENDDTAYLGNSARRWKAVYAVDGTINTSDAREKKIYDITEKERKVAEELKNIVKKFKWLSAIDQKGEDKARFHFGWVAQDIVKIFEKYGLDAFQYGLVGYDEWYETENGETIENISGIDTEKMTYTYPDGKTVKVVKKDRYSVRPNEIIAFILMAM